MEEKGTEGKSIAFPLLLINETTTAVCNTVQE